MQTGCGPLYVTVNEDNKGLFELFTTMGRPAAALRPKVRPSDAWCRLHGEAASRRAK